MGYQEEYYQERREKILQDRALRYASDEAYREAVKARARLRNMNSRAVPKELTTMVMFDGKQEKLYRVMDLPPVLNRTYSVIRAWRSSGIVPRPCCRDAMGKAVFSQSQALLLQYIVSSMDKGLLPITYSEMKMILRKFWRKRYSKSAVLKELVRSKNANQLGDSTNRRGSILTERRKRQNTNTRISKNRIPAAAESKGVARYGRKVRRKNKGTET